jgi:hypothetical protein
VFLSFTRAARLSPVTALDSLTGPVRAARCLPAASIVRSSCTVRYCIGLPPAETGHHRTAGPPRPRPTWVGMRLCLWLCSQRPGCLSKRRTTRLAVKTNVALPVRPLRCVGRMEPRTLAGEPLLGRLRWASRGVVCPWCPRHPADRPRANIPVLSGACQCTVEPDVSVVDRLPPVRTLLPRVIPREVAVPQDSLHCVAALEAPKGSRLPDARSIPQRVAGILAAVAGNVAVGEGHWWDGPTPPTRQASSLLGWQGSRVRPKMRVPDCRHRSALEHETANQGQYP